MTRLPAHEALWTSHPKARALIASLSARPPRSRYVTGTLGPNDGELRPTGKRVAALRKLWRDAEPLIDTPAWNEWLRNDPDKAIRDAVEHETKGIAA